MKRVAVVGLGAVGTVLAVFLKNAGHTVYGIVKDNQIKDIKDKVIRVDGIWGEHKAKLDGVFKDINDIKENLDLIIVAVKSYDTEKVAENLKNAISKNSFVLLTQNGYGNYEKTISYVPAEKVLLGRVIFGAKVNHPGYVTVTVNADDIRIGQPENLADECKVIEIACILKHAGIPASYSPEVYKVLWDKILYNCALNPLGAILEKSYGQLAENPHTSTIMNNIVKEIFEVCKLNNIPLNFPSAESYLEHFYKNLIPPTKDHYPSMYYDLKSGKKTEIDALNGAIVELGKKVGYIPVINLTITTIIKAKEDETT